MIDATTRRCALLMASALGLGSSCFAQGAPFRVGDRVQASPMSLSDPKYWRACTVTQVHEFVPKRAYSLQCDAPAGGGAPGAFLVNQDWVRAAPANAPVAGASATASAPASRPGPVAAPRDASTEGAV